MKKPHMLIAAMLGMTAAPAWAGDIEPGQWEMTTTMQGDNLPPGMPRERTETECFTPEQAQDLEATLRQNFTEDACDGAQTSRDGETISYRFSCQGQGGAMEARGSATIEDPRHLSFDMTSRYAGSDTELAMTTEGKWVSESCEM